MNTRIKRLSDIAGLEKYSDYYIDMNGIIYSQKRKVTRIVKPTWVKRKGYYLKVNLHHKGKHKGFYIHKLVALAFIPCENTELTVRHKNGNVQDNRVENLEWFDENKRLRSKLKYDGFLMKEELSEKINRVHLASLKKGLPIQNQHDFIEMILDRALDDYVTQYGLRRLL